ncbi:MAG: peptide chain release factor N(5)-glutamine methyltransferase [Candidatus Faecousia sp.]|nr:peptide chain release factor N(5)-glutamine methyltransferase [Clostridiales bacterium]MDD7651854.1 peptide chain release factor N(5)-glutamine methyltransferase [Bacillota bacterium]MDY4219206.1 peptide chain release factor N(5)-glutamine methyltransferase [Candidatus Faecousia sp.]
MVKRYSDLYMDTRKALLPTEGQQRAGLIARELLCAASGKTQEAIIAARDAYASQEVCRKMEDFTERALRGEPLAYILEEWDFYGMTLHVTKDVLIPRDDTCAVTELAIKKALFLEQDPRILDLCTGSGCIGLAIARKVKDARVTLADISREALAVAKKNVVGQKLTGRVSCVQADALGTPPAFLGNFDLIVSNPPYVRSGDMAGLQPSVRDFEPALALDGGRDGLDFYRAIGANYAARLKPQGWLCFEFGMGQGDEVCRILEKNGFRIVERKQDYNGIERAVLAQKNREEDEDGIKENRV